MVDASAVVEVLLNTPSAPRIADRIFQAAESLHVPHLLDLEVAQVVRRAVLRGDIPALRGNDALDSLAKPAVTRYPHEQFLPRIWELRHNLTAYDAVYVALAESLAAPLITRDAAFGSRSHDAAVELF